MLAQNAENSSFLDVCIVLTFAQRTSTRSPPFILFPFPLFFFSFFQRVHVLPMYTVTSPRSLTTYVHKAVTLSTQSAFRPLRCFRHFQDARLRTQI